MLQFNYNLFWIFFFFFFWSRGVNCREDLISEAEPDGDQGSRDLYVFTRLPSLRFESSTSTLVLPTSMISVFSDVFLTALPFFNPIIFWSPDHNFGIADFSKADFHRDSDYRIFLRSKLFWQQRKGFLAFCFLWCLEHRQSFLEQFRCSGQGINKKSPHTACSTKYSTCPRIQETILVDICWWVS